MAKRAVVDRGSTTGYVCLVILAISSAYLARSESNL